MSTKLPFKKYTSIENTKNEVLENIRTTTPEHVLNSDWVVTEKVHGCFSGDTKVTLADGSQKCIQELVNSQYSGEVLGVGTNGTIVTTKIKNWFNNGKRNNWRKVTLKFEENNNFSTTTTTTTTKIKNTELTLKCTDNHRFFSQNKYIPLYELKENDLVESIIPFNNNNNNNNNDNNDQDFKNQKKNLSKIIKIEPLNLTQEDNDSYDLETETHNYFANNIHVHNSNFSLITNGKEITAAKRTSILSCDETKFFNFTQVRDRYKENVCQAFYLLQNYFQNLINENENENLKNQIQNQDNNNNNTTTNSNSTNNKTNDKNIISVSESSWLNSVKEEIRTNGLQSITIFGELFGGGYPHPDHKSNSNSNNERPVQKGIYYCTYQDFYPFDIYINAKIVLDYDLVLYTLSAAEFPVIAQPLFRGCFEEALAYSLRTKSEPTTLPSMFYDLPEIENNIREGHVLKPVHPARGPKGSRIILKDKNPKWNETAPPKKKNQNTKHELGASFSDQLQYLISELDRYLTLNRLRNVMSKIGSVDKNQKMGMIAGKLAQDALAEFRSDFQNEIAKLEDGEKKRLGKKASTQAKDVVSKNKDNI